jgi:hypothetical protein
VAGSIGPFSFLFFPRTCRAKYKKNRYFFPRKAIYRGTIVGCIIKKPRCRLDHRAGTRFQFVAELTKGALRAMSSTLRIFTMAVVLPLSLLAGRAAFRPQRVQAGQPRAAAQRAELVQPPAAGDADDQVTLQWKLQKDKVFYQEVTVITRQALKEMNGEIKRAQEQTFYFSWRPVGQDKDGNWVLKQKVEGVRIAIDNMDGVKVEYDSRNDDGSDTRILAWSCRLFVDSEFLVTYGKDSSVHKVEGRDELIKKLSAADPWRKILSQPALGETTLLQAAEILLNPLNPKAVRPGDSWTRQQMLDCPLIGKIQSSYRFNCGRQEGEITQIQVQSTVDVNEIKGKGKEIKGSGTGIVLFDSERGRIVSEELELKLKGKIDIAGQGLNLIPDPATLVHEEAELTESQKITVKISDINPAS